MTTTNKKLIPQADGMRQYAKLYQQKALDEAQQYRIDAFYEASIEDYEAVSSKPKLLRRIINVITTVLGIGLIFAMPVIILAIFGLF